MSFIEKLTEFRKLTECKNDGLAVINEKLRSELLILQRENNTLSSDLFDRNREVSRLKIEVQKAESATAEMRDTANYTVKLQEKIRDLQTALDEKETEMTGMKDSADEERVNLNEKILDLEIKMKQEIARRERAEEASDYYKKLAENYQSMPDLKNLVDNIAAFKVPDIKEFAECIKKISELKEPITESLKEQSDKIDEVRRAIDFFMNDIARRRF